MLSREDNETLTRVGPGTPMGELFRRFWLPALIADELPGPDCAPVRLRILCEDLLAFRDSDGRVGIVDAYCAHRGAPLFFGRNEQGGIRCAYHGWKFAADGRCIDLPNAENVRDDPRLLARMAIVAYPVQEAGGIVWIYMGPRDHVPDMPALEWLHLPAGHCHASRWLQRSNWLQGAEGEIDTSHISFLHQDHDPSRSQIGATGANLAVDGAPDITVRETDYGFASCARRRYGQQWFWRISQWLLPMYSLIPRAPSEQFTGAGGRAWVPVDDHHTTTFAYSFRVDRPLSEQELDLIASGAHFPPRTTRTTLHLPEGQPIDTHLPVANYYNDYGIDREIQRRQNFTGIDGVSAQDRAVQEGMRSPPGEPRGIVDRTREHLVRSDVAIVTARRRLLKLARDLQAGIEPHAARCGAAYGTRAISRICDVADADQFLERFGQDMAAAMCR
ncbi:MAG TPA: Rieske 2Fe-2S domain-containing protein [Burkholderiaceae bacterium]|nr:Rieske 2Fe-2S domain-containing protein [Burkholderiaceae bacterium]